MTGWKIQSLLAETSPSGLVRFQTPAHDYLESDMAAVLQNRPGQRTRQTRWLSQGNLCKPGKFDRHRRNIDQEAAHCAVSGASIPTNNSNSQLTGIRHDRIFGGAGVLAGRYIERNPIRLL